MEKGIMELYVEAQISTKIEKSSFEVVAWMFFCSSMTCQ